MSPGLPSHRYAPHAVLLALTLAAFLAGSFVPYRVDTDTGFQLKPIQQWLQDESTTPATHRLPDPRDLSRDTLLWSNWWPPGFPFLYTPLAAAGLRFADALRFTSLLLFLVGGLGWLRLADRMDLPPWIRVLYVVSLAAYAVTLGGAASLRSPDLLAFAATPWLAGLVLRHGERDSGPAGLLLAGLALGATYWLRYALFLAALPLAAWLALRLLLDRRRPPGLRIARLAALGLGFVLPIAALFALNLRLSDNLKETLTGTRSAWIVDETGPSRPPVLALSLAAAPGLGLFQNDLWMNHLCFFSDARLPFLRGRSSAGRISLKALLALPATAALIWGLARERRRRPSPFISLAVLVAVGFYLALTFVSVMVGYNYLATEPRFAAGFMPLLHPLVLSGWLNRERRPAIVLGAAAFTLFFLPPLAFAAANFAANEIGDRARLPYTASGTGLFMPEFSSGSVPEVLASIRSALRSPNDLVVLAGPSGWGSAFMMWLEIPQRTLPVSTFYAPLGARYLDAANLRGTGNLTSSRDLRVVLVAAHSLERDGSLARLQARFPQVPAWRTAPVPTRSTVGIWVGDLEAR